MTASNNGPRINLVRITHVFYTHREIDAAHQFMLDFGFQKVKRVGKDIYYRGTSSEPFIYCARQGEEDAFRRATFVVESKSDLVAATKLPRATWIYDLGDAPGDRRCVTFYNPIDEFLFHLIHRQKPNLSEKVLPQLPFNFINIQTFFKPTDKHRAGNRTQRFAKGPAPVHKLGHFRMCVTDFTRSLEFYTTHFNFKPSDLVHDSTERDITAFLHLDRGREFVDHHCFFLFEGPKSHVYHSSFETHDFDTQVLGYDWLRSKGYENCWGVGRHIIGSQIFDYWFNPSRFIIEYYVDGDLVNN
ncbi:Glyoxalase/Bleomycin resistance protein/Dihydroxybiphenyl dioxygenase [Aspergillus ambiguus]|uniref:Glyoxalase/Bleomycin resistance protein/Dihydroxybiphenyl dioxygenase n=1 Tax=Aspergillus ambiguus TaxID=176160 RepID=UPI003CCD360D